jgi:hypothetical protein
MKVVNAVRRSASAALHAMRDPGVRAGVILSTTAVAGFVLFALSWRGVARTIYVPFQLPWVVSAGVVGLALIGGSLGFLSIHIGRRADAAHRATVEEIVRTAVALTDDIRGERIPTPRRQG